MLCCSATVSLLCRTYYGAPVPDREAAGPSHLFSTFLSPATYLVPIVVHGHQAVEVIDVAALGQLAHQVWFDSWLGTLVAGRGREAFHTDGAVLTRGRKPY